MKTNFEERRAVYQTLCAVCAEKACARSTDCDEFRLAVNAVRTMNAACIIAEQASKLQEDAKRNFDTSVQIVLRCARRRQGGTNE